MIMKKVRPHVVAILVVLAFAFTAIAFLAPFEHGFNFIVAYAAGMLAILLQIPVFKLAYPPETPLKSQVLGYPIYRVGILYMIIQTILSLVIFSIGDSAPPWSTLLLCILVLAGALVLGLTAKMAREAISNMETVKNADTRLMKSLALRAEALTTRTSDPMLAQEIKKLAENISYSDPVSSTAIAEQEFKLAELFGQLESAVVGNNPGAIDLCRNVNIALEDRNIACKANK